MHRRVMNQNIRRNHFRDFHSRLSICVDLKRILQLLPIELIPQFILQNPKQRDILRVRRNQPKCRRDVHIARNRGVQMSLQNRVRTPHHLLEMVLKRNDSLFQQRIDRLNLLNVESMHAILTIHQLNRSVIMHVFVRHWRVVMNALNRRAADSDAVSLIVPFGN